MCVCMLAGNELRQSVCMGCVWVCMHVCVYHMRVCACVRACVRARACVQQCGRGAALRICAHTLNHGC